MQYEKSCGAIVYRFYQDKLQVVLVKQSLHNYWGFPKGHMEIGESEKQTAIREVKEEVGLDIKIKRGFRYVNKYSVAPKIIKSVIYFAAEVLAGDLTKQESEISDLKWLNIDEAYTMLTYQNNKRALNKFIEFLEGGQISD